ncbi:TetR/AcrR family transcriptional regulator [Streptomyces sp. NPDC002004]
MTANASDQARRKRLTPEREQELYRAVIDVLREVGYDALTMDAVAARAHSSKTTLYRQWKGKPELVTTALRGTRPVSSEAIDTGSLVGDLRELANGVGATAHEDAPLIRGIAHAAGNNPDLAVAMREHLIGPELAGLRQLLARAAARGEIAANNPATDFMPHALLGAVISRRLLEDVEADADFMHRYIDAFVLPALGAGH